jgi:hypothetical protein
LITGSLGTAVGVFENAVDLLSSYHRSGQLIRPLVVASTATVRNAEAQVRALYGRGVDVFPPQVLDVRDTFFSREIAVTEETPGRKYLGICAHGIRLTLAEIRISEVLLLAGQKLLDEFGDAADPYMTTVGYFSATRELAGMRRYLDDDVTTRVTGNTEPFPRRTNDWARLLIGELTSRISSEEIAGTLDQLGLEFDASRWSTPGKAARRRRNCRVLGPAHTTWCSRPRCSKSGSMYRGSGSCSWSDNRRTPRSTSRPHPEWDVMRSDRDWWCRSRTGHDHATWRTSSNSGTTTRRSMPRSRRSA